MEVEETFIPPLDQVSSFPFLQDKGKRGTTDQEEIWIHFILPLSLSSHSPLSTYYVIMLTLQMTLMRTHLKKLQGLRELVSLIHFPAAGMISRQQQRERERERGMTVASVLPILPHLERDSRIKQKFTSILTLGKEEASNLAIVLEGRGKENGISKRQYATVRNAVDYCERELIRQAGRLHPASKHDLQRITEEAGVMLPDSVSEICWNNWQVKT